MSERSSLSSRILPKLALSLLLGGLFAWIASKGGVPIVPTDANAFASVKPWAVPVYVAVLALTTFFRASRWRFLAAPIKQISLKEVIAINWIGFFAIFALPLRLGEFARPALGKMRSGIPVSAGFGTVAVERVIDGLITSICVVWALFALPHVETTDKLARALPYYGLVAVSVFGGAFFGLFLFLWKRSLAVRLVQLTFGLVSPKLATLVAAKIDSVAEGVRSLADIKLATGFIAESLLYWGLNAAGMWLLAVGVGLQLSFAQSIAVMGVLAIGILLPAGPGLFGSFQVAVSVALKLYFDESVVSSTGVTYIFLLYGIQAVFICIGGIVPLYAMKVRMSDLLSPPSGPESIPPAKEASATR